MTDPPTPARLPRGLTDAESGRPWPKVSRLRTVGPVVLIVAALIAAGVSATVTRTTARARRRILHGHRQQLAHSTVPITYAAAPGPARRPTTTGGPSATTRPVASRCRRSTRRPASRLPRRAGTAAPRQRRHGRRHQRRLLPGPTGRPDVGHPGAAGTPAQGLATVQAYVAMFDRIFEMYGRHVNLIPFEASGADTDPVAAHADAVTVAEQLTRSPPSAGPARPTPTRTNWPACTSCAWPAATPPPTARSANAPYQWANLPTADTSLIETVDYVVAKLNGKDAIWAGDPSLHTQKRTFIVVSETSEPPSPGTAELTASDQEVAGRSRPHGLSEHAQVHARPDHTAHAGGHHRRKAQASGATSVVFAGDPIMPIYLTKACAQIGYFPEWIITGIVLTDTSALGRYYNQSEWAHTFGVSSLAVPDSGRPGDAYRLYRWWYGATTPPASVAAPAIIPPIMQLFVASSWPGPTSPRTPSPPACSGPRPPEAARRRSLDAYGYQGAAPLPSYSSPADYTFIWYDATAKGPDEEGVRAAGSCATSTGAPATRRAPYRPGPCPCSRWPARSQLPTPPDLAPSSRPGRALPWPASRCPAPPSDVASASPTRWVATCLRRHRVGDGIRITYRMAAANSASECAAVG